MGKAFWIRRFFFVWGLAFVVIAMAQVLKGRELMFAVAEGARWGLLASMVFVTARVWQSRRKQHCAICRDTPEMHETGDSRTRQQG